MTHLDLELGRGQGNASVNGLLRPICIHNHKLIASGSAQRRPSAFWSNQHFANFEVTWSSTGENFRNMGQTSCSPILPWSTMNFELRGRLAEEKEYEKCNFRKFRCPVTLTLDGIKVISAYTTRGTTSIQDHVTVGSSNMEIWPFGSAVISTFCKVWTHVIVFWGGNLKIGLRKAIDEVPYYRNQPSVLSSVTADPLAILGAFLTLPGTKSSTSDSGSEQS